MGQRITNILIAKVMYVVVMHSIYVCCYNQRDYDLRIIPQKKDRALNSKHVDIEREDSVVVYPVF